MQRTLIRNMARLDACCFLALLSIAYPFAAAQADPEPSANSSVVPDPALEEFANTTALFLVDADANARLQPLRDGDTINLFALPSRNVTIEAVTDAAVSRVDFRLNNQTRFRTETSRPFSLVGDEAGNFRSWNPTPGRYALEVTPHSKNGRRVPYRIHFTIIDQPPNVSSPPQSEGEFDVVKIDQPIAVAAEPEARGALSPSSADVDEPLVTIDRSAPPDERAEPEDDAAPIAAPSPPEKAPDYELISEEEYPETKCMGFVSDETEHLTVVCAHQFSDTEAANVLLKSQDGDSKKLCDFLNTQSPMITDCASSLAVIHGLHRGQLYVALRRRTGSYLGIPIRTN